MEKREQNRLRLAQAYEACLQSKPESKITVRDITASCGMTRQIFYRHFADKKALIYWYHAYLVQQNTLTSERFLWADSVREVMQMMQAHQRFYTKASRDCNDSVLLEILTREIGLLYQNVIEYNLHRGISEELAILLRIYCTGGVKYLYHWLQTGMKRPIPQMVELFYAAMPEALRELLTVDAVPIAYLKRSGGDPGRMGATDLQFHG